MYATIEDAMQALKDAEHDVAGDYGGGEAGEAMVEAAWGDIVHAVAGMCDDPKVAAELIRRNL